MAKFSTGDDFKIIENGITGKIINVKRDAQGDVVEYQVQWDHFKRGGWYPVSEVDDLWETDLAPTIAALHKALNSLPHLPMGAPQALDFIPISFTIDDLVVPCDHKWDGYCGLQGLDEQCVKCNVKRVDIETS